MAVQTAASTAVKISKTIPATFDVAGYEALDDFEIIGEVVDAGTHGRVYEVIRHNPLASRGTQKFKGSFDEGTKTLEMALDGSDDGQILAKEALDSDDNYSFMVEYPDGSADYFQAKVVSFQKTAATVDTIISASMDIEITTSKDGVGIVEASA